MLALVAVLCAATLGWSLTLGDGLDPDPSASAAPVPPATPALAASATARGLRPPDSSADDDERGREPVAEAGDGETGLQIRLRGLHPDAPWTDPIAVTLADDADHEAHLQGTPDAGGRCNLTLPRWVDDARIFELDIESRDPNYQWLDYRHQGPLDFDRELVLDVQVEAVLYGLVLDANAAPVASVRLAAFAILDDTIVDAKVGEVSSDSRGTYRLHVPPGVPLVLVAAPMRQTGGRVMVTDRNGYGIDSGDLRCDLLPASQRTRGRVGQPTHVPDFVLSAATPATGSVHWSDGTPVALATVQTLPQDATTLHLEPQSFVQVLPNGTLLPGASADTDDDGAFTLPGLLGQALDVTVVRLQEATLVGTGPRARLVPPNRTELVLPRPVRIRVVQDRAPVPHAQLAIAGVRTLTAGATGTVDVVCLQAIRVRADRERWRSRWIDLGPAAAGTTVTLPLEVEVGEVSLEFEGEFPVRNTLVHWRCDDGREGHQHLLRDDRGGPFRLFFQPGHYHLVAGPGGGERNGLFLLPAEREIDVAVTTPVSLRLPARLGGMLTIDATDPNGLHAPGTCRVFDAAGVDCSDRFAVAEREGAIGELLPGGGNRLARILPPGPYHLTMDFGALGAHERQVAIRPREVTEVRLRL